MSAHTLSRDIGPEGNNVNCRNVIVIARYLEDTLGTCGALFDGLPFTREYLIDEVHWIPLAVYTKIIKRAGVMLNEPNASFHIGLSAAQVGSWGESFAALQKLFAAIFFTPRAAYKRLPEFVKHFNHTKDFRIRELTDGRCVLEVLFKPNINPLDDYESDFFIRGILAGIPSIWHLPPARVRPLRLAYRVPELLMQEFAHVQPRVSLDKQGLIINGARCGLWQKDGRRRVLRITKNFSCDKRIVLREGELYHAPTFLYEIQWQNQNTLHKLITVLRHLFTRRRTLAQSADRQLSIIRRYAEGLEEVVKERTRELRAAKEEVEAWKEKAERLLYGLLPRDIALEMMDEHFKPRRLYATTLFTDLAGFTEYAKTRTPTEVEHVLNEYFERLIAVIMAHGGWVIKPRGDGVHAVFGIDAKDGHELRAVRAALQAQAMMRDYPWGMRVGIDAGEMIIGQIGAHNAKRLDCTGHSVNIAARLEGAAECGEVVVLEVFAKKIAAHFKTQPCRQTELKGIGAVSLFRVHPSLPHNK